MANPAKTPPPHFPPPFLTRRRVIIACTNCRKRKIRCLTPEDPPLNPCDRCTEKGLKCEYITITNQKNQKAGSRKNASEADAELSGTASTSSPPVRLPPVHTAHPSAPHDFHVHPAMYRSQSQPVDAYGPLFGAHDHHLPLPHPDPPAGYGGREYHRPYSSMIQPRVHPYVFPTRDFTGYDAALPPVYDQRRLRRRLTASNIEQSTSGYGFQQT
ncbi:hypothetical protein B0H19DRAFT_1081678 [Mycena capillaripes]|nr:hypothetical protein B0H19DRAFT_1081678 [Mycena capillaripes]